MVDRPKSAVGDTDYLDWYDKAKKMSEKDERTGLEILRELISMCENFLTRSS